MTPAPKDKPAADELEVSLFGPGVGESVVVHVGAGKWMVVDSCIDADTASPPALTYLNEIGVDVAKDVDVLVVSHWHDDHTAGMTTLFKACHRARLVCSAAMNSQEFFTLVAASTKIHLLAGRGSGIDEMAALFGELRARRTKSGGRVVAPTYALANTIVHRSDSLDGVPACVVEALSPSSASLSRASLSVVRLMEPKKALPSPGPNELSVALHVSFGETEAVLAADLENGSSDALGWRAVFADDRNRGKGATLLKVAHHGSKGADHAPLFGGMLANVQLAGVTPFNSCGLPTTADIARLKARGAPVYHTSPQKPPKVRLDRGTEKALGNTTIRERRGKMGHVRFRCTSGGAPRVDLFGAAAEV